MPTLFDLGAHHAFVARHGEIVEWSRATLCPCGLGANKDAGRSRPTCPVCHGFGFRYMNPTNLTGIITAVRFDKQQVEGGIAEPGDLYLGLSPYDASNISDYDSFRLPGWNVGHTYEGEIQRRQQVGGDVLNYEVKKVYECYVVDQPTGIITSFTTPDDFTVTGRTLSWVTGHGPAVDQMYSIKYNALFEWIAFVTPVQRMEQGINLGTKALLRKRHAVKRP